MRFIEVTKCISGTKVHLSDVNIMVNSRNQLSLVETFLPVELSLDPDSFLHSLAHFQKDHW